MKKINKLHIERNKGMKKIPVFIIIFLILGLYVDFKMMPNDDSICFKKYRQRTFNIQTIIPFQPERWTIYLGVGNKYYEHIKEIYIYKDKVTGEELSRNEYDQGCSSGRYDGFYYRSTYIDLRFRSPIINEGQVIVEEDIYKISKEDFRGGINNI